MSHWGAVVGCVFSNCCRLAVGGVNFFIMLQTYRGILSKGDRTFFLVEFSVHEGQQSIP